MNQLLNSFLPLVVVFFNCTTIFALEKVTISEIDFSKPTSLARYIDVYKTKYTFSVNDFENAKSEGKLIKTQNKTSQGISDYSFWTSFQINWDNTAPLKLLLEIDKAQLDEILLYQKIGNAYKLIGEGGDRNRNFYERTISNRRYIFPLSSTGTTTQYLLKVENTNKSISFPLTLWNTQVFKKSDNNKNLCYFAYVILSVFIGFFSLIAGVFLNKKIFIIYTFYVVLACFYILCNTGYAFQYIYPNSSNLNNTIRYLLIPINNTIGLILCQLILKTKNHSIQLHKFFNFLKVFFIVLAMLWFIAPVIHHKFSAQLLLFYYLYVYLAFILMNIAAIKSYKFYPLNSILFFSSFFFLIIGVICELLIETGFLEKYIFPISPVMIGLFCEIVGLTIMMVIILRNILNERNRLIIENEQFLIKEKELTLENHNLKKELQEVSKVQLRKNATKTIQLKSKAIIDLEKLGHISSNGRYLEFFIVTKDKPEIDRNTLKNILLELPNNFIQIHRSHIINLNFLRSINNNEVLLASGNILPISRSFKSQLLETFKKV